VIWLEAKIRNLATQKSVACSAMKSQQMNTKVMNSQYSWKKKCDLSSLAERKMKDRRKKEDRRRIESLSHYQK